MALPSNIGRKEKGMSEKILDLLKSIKENHVEMLDLKFVDLSVSGIILRSPPRRSTKRFFRRASPLTDRVRRDSRA